MKRIQPYRILISVVLFATLFATQGLLSEYALAHGPGGTNKIRVNNEQIGPYNLLVATAPETIIVGQLDVWVRVADNETNRLLRDAVVMVEATPRSSGSIITAQATHDHAGNAFDYVAHLEIEDSGQWDFTVYVEDEPGQVDVTFSDMVRQGSPTNLLIVLAVLFIVVVVAVGILLSRQSVAMSEQNNLATG